MTKDTIDHWKNMGTEFGYPQCCIDQFCSGVDFGRDEKLNRQDRIHQRYGFIPCDKHAEMIDKGKTTLELLIQNRTHPIPFPHDITDVPYGLAPFKDLLKAFTGIVARNPSMIVKVLKKSFEYTTVDDELINELEPETEESLLDFLEQQHRNNKDVEFFLSFEYPSIQIIMGTSQISLVIPSDLTPEEMYNRYNQFPKKYFKNTKK